MSTPFIFRPFVALALVFGLTCGDPERPAEDDPEEWARKLRADIETSLEEARAPGLAAAILVRGTPVWIEAMGLATVETGDAMTRETVLNVGSVSKLATATAVMLAVEDGLLDLDADVSDYLPFPLHHPAAPETPVTARQLLTHSAGINDSAAYGASYACGDPAISLEDWLRGYFTPEGAYFSDESFLPTGPGKAFEYSNVGYGLLGLLVESVSGLGFSDYTKNRIFEPLGMTDTGWLLRELGSEHLATPYWLQTADAQPDPEEEALLVEGEFEEGAFVPFCLYSFYNYPDGLLRTNIGDLASFVMATLPGNEGGPRLLQRTTRDAVFRDQLPHTVQTDGRLQGLGWRQTESERFGTLWGHGGADPGIRAHVLHRPDDGVTVIVMVNRLVVAELSPILERLFEEGARLSNSES